MWCVCVCAFWPLPSLTPFPLLTPPPSLPFSFLPPLSLCSAGVEAGTRAAILGHSLVVHVAPAVLSSLSRVPPERFHPAQALAVGEVLGQLLST
jgi:hypothetical protein